MFAPTVIRASGRELDDSEVEDILGSDDEALAEGVQAFTGAEVALMEDDGYEVNSMPGGRSNVDARDGQTIFSYGKGQSQFTGVMVDHTGNSEKVFLYTRSGHARLVRKDWVRHYLAKVGPQGQVFFVKPPVKAPVPTIACRKEGCPKKLLTLLQAKRHFQTKHSQDWQDEQATRQMEADERGISLQEQNLAVLQAILGQQGGVVSPDAIAAVQTALRPENLMPQAEWNKRDILNWMASNGWQVTPEVSSKTRDALLELIGIDDEGEPDDGGEA